MNKNGIVAILKTNGYKCNADGRRQVYEAVGALAPRELDPKYWAKVLKEAERVGGCRPGEVYKYTNAQGTVSEARVCDLYDLPKGMVNPIAVCFSGIMTAHLCTMEMVRFYTKQTGELLDFLPIGLGGNKGLFEDVFNQPGLGLMAEAEYKAYINLLEQLAPRSYVRANERACQDTDTAGNFDELYRFAKESGKEVTFVLCSGNAFYDKRVLAEFLLKARDAKYADAKMNFVLAHCPIITDLEVVDGRLSEIMLGYVAAAIWPLRKDTVTFEGKTTSQNPERYLMPGVEDAEWPIFEELIRQFNNMGWPNGAEMLYGVSHKEAVLELILSDLHARGAFSKESYERELRADLEKYQTFLGGKYKGGDNINAFVDYLKKTTDEHRW